MLFIGPEPRVGEARELVSDVAGVSIDNLRKFESNWKKHPSFINSIDHKNIEVIKYGIGLHDKFNTPLSQRYYPRAYAAYVRAGLYVLEQENNPEILNNLLHNCNQKNLNDLKRQANILQ